MNNKKGCLQTYQQVYANMIADELGKRKISEVNHNQVQKLINQLHKDGYSLSRVKLAHVVMHDMLETALLNNWITKNPAEKINFPSEQQVESRVMSKEEQKTFLSYASGSIYFDFYMAALCTGMRIGEVLGLQWDDIDFENKILHVTGTLVYIRGEGRFKDTPKTQSGYRTIPMVSQIETMLKQRQAQQTMMKFLLKVLTRMRDLFLPVRVESLFGILPLGILPSGLTLRK